MKTIRVSTPQEEGILQVSKCLKYQVLLDATEMASLFSALGSFYLGVVSEPVSLESAIIEKEVFLEKYKEYIDPLKRGELPIEAPLRKYFSTALSADVDAFYAMSVRGERYLLKSIQPVIQIQAHHFLYSSTLGTFHPLVLGKDSVTWGLQFSYPQIAQDPKTCAIQKVAADAPNTLLFGALSRWLREYTRPTPFVVGEKRSNEPIRIGKVCFSWIARHPQLQSKGIQIRGANGD